MGWYIVGNPRFISSTGENHQNISVKYVKLTIRVSQSEHPIQIWNSLVLKTLLSMQICCTYLYHSRTLHV